MTATVAILLIIVAQCSGFSAFWTDPSLVSSLPDPPSPERLALIQEKPYKGGFEPAVDADGPYEPVISYGKIPDDLVGSLASNGAGRIRVGDTQYGHWFDGDGYVSMLNLDGKANRATFHGRYIRTKRFLEQQKLMEKIKKDQNEDALAQPPLAFSGAWTKRGRGEWYENIGRIPTSPANTATMWVKSSSKPKLYALCEGGHPIQLDPKTLEVIRDEQPFSSSDGSNVIDSFFSAHFKRCPITGDLYNHGFLIRPGPLPKEINVMKLSSDGSLLHQAKSPLPFDCFVHDSAMSANYLIFFLPPYYVPNDKVLAMISGTESLGKLLEWRGEDDTTYLQINSKNYLKVQWRIELPGTTSLYHFLDAFEEPSDDDDGSICLKVRIAEHEPADRVALENQFADQYRVADKRIDAVLREYNFHLGRNGDGHFLSKRNVANDATFCEYPVVNSSYRPTDRRRFCWTNALSDPSVEWLNGIQKVDMDTGASSKVITFGPDTYAGPPSFVPKRENIAEDDGYILTTVYRSTEHRSDVVVLDAATLETLCIMQLRNHLPFQFHGDYLCQRTDHLK